MGRLKTYKHMGNPTNYIPETVNWTVLGIIWSTTVAIVALLFKEIKSKWTYRALLIEQENQKRKDFLESIANQAVDIKLADYKQDFTNFKKEFSEFRITMMEFVSSINATVLKMAEGKR